MATGQIREPRAIVCCFDGTGNRFGENSNIVRLFGALDKSQPERQIVYYQPGIGTYTKRQPVTTVFSSILSAVDGAVALYLNDHVKEGYKFIMQNYRDGDKICLFGFSRGAHIARVVAGMVYKIGVLPAHNEQQIDFAFSICQEEGEKGNILSKEFRKTFSRPAKVEFVGVWDTVSSVGIIPRHHRGISINYAVNHVRHALALDERRARFRPVVWHEPTIDNEQDIDVDEPVMPEIEGFPEKALPFEAPNRDYADVKEVWFAGCHADIGGGSHSNKVKDSLSYIPLRWMIKECFSTQLGLLFDYEALVNLGFNLEEFVKKLEAENIPLEPLNLNDNQIKEVIARTERNMILREPAPNDQQAIAMQVGQAHPNQKKFGFRLMHERDTVDKLALVWDQLVLQPVWWILETLPMLTARQDNKGEWSFVRRRNNGEGRHIASNDDKSVMVHGSVKGRIESTADDPLNEYLPAARNWKELQDRNLISYVD